MEFCKFFMDSKILYYFWSVCLLFPEINICGLKLFFEDKTSDNKVIKLNEKEFVILDKQILDCVHGNDRCF